MQLPNGLKFIFGWDPTGVNSIKTGGAWFNCQGPTAKPGHYTTLTTALANCPAGNQVGAIIQAPGMLGRQESRQPGSPQSRGLCQLWDVGLSEVPVDAPVQHPDVYDGRLVYGRVGRQYERSGSCRSDHMAPGQPKGHTFHADFFMAWDPTVHDMWWQNCINKLLNCSAGELGNGKQLEGADQPTYGWQAYGSAAGAEAVIGVRLIALAAALGSAGAAQAEVIEVGAGGTVKVLSDAPNATWSSTDQADQVEAIEGGVDRSRHGGHRADRAGLVRRLRAGAGGGRESERHQPLSARSSGLAGEPLEPFGEIPAQVPSVWRN